MVFQEVSLPLEIVRNQLVEGAHVEGLEEIVAAGASFFQGQNDVLDAVVGVGASQVVGQGDEVAGIRLVFHPERVDERAQDDDQQLHHFPLADAFVELKDFGGGQGLGFGEADADVGQHGAGFGGGLGGKGGSRSGCCGSQ